MIGTLDLDCLTSGAVMDLEEAQITREVINWLVTYAGADGQAVTRMLRPLPASETRALAVRVAQAVNKAVQVPKANGRR